MRKYLLCLLAAVVFITGCAYSSRSILPPYAKTICIPNLLNKTYQYGVEEEFTNYLIQAFIVDSRLVVGKKENSQIELRGEITQYALQPLSYDDEGVIKEYKIWMLTNLVVNDITTGKVLWRESNIEGSTTFVPEFSSLVGMGNAPKTEVEARRVIYEDLSRIIVRRTIDGW